MCPPDLPYGVTDALTWRANLLRRGHDPGFSKYHDLGLCHILSTLLSHTIAVAHNGRPREKAQMRITMHHSRIRLLKVSEHAFVRLQMEYCAKTAYRENGVSTGLFLLFQFRKYWRRRYQPP